MLCWRPPITLQTQLSIEALHLHVHNNLLHICLATHSNCSHAWEAAAWLMWRVLLLLLLLHCQVLCGMCAAALYPGVHSCGACVLLHCAHVVCAAAALPGAVACC